MNPNLAARLIYYVSLGRINFADDTTSIQKLQVAQAPGPSGEPSLLDDVSHPQLFGFSANPPPQSDVVLLRVFGNLKLSIAVSTNHQPSRLKNLQPGDTAIYDLRGAKVYLGPAGIVIDGAGLPLTIQNVGGLINAPGATIQCQDVVTAAGVDLNGHAHTGVQSGMGISGPPST